GISGQPGVDASFNLYGSAFMEGASDITVGGKTFHDGFVNDNGYGYWGYYGDSLLDGDVTGGSANNNYRLRLPLTLDGSITTRTGTASSDGTHLTVTVPALAISGPVRVSETGSSYDLEVVPTVRAVGRDLGAGPNAVIEGTGLSGNLVVLIDGNPATILGFKT